MASFEKKISEIFDENPRLARKIPVVIRKMFQESDAEFKRRVRNMPEEEQQSVFLILFDVLFIDCFFESLNDRFLNWVIKNHPEKFTEDELEEMRAQSLSHLDFYEVQKVYPGRGSDIQSLFTHEKGFLRDISSSRSLAKWDIFLSRCYRHRGEYLATGSLTLFTQDNKKFIVSRIDKAMSESIDGSRNDSFPEFAKAHWEVFYQIAREIRERALNKKFYTKYGELQLCEVRFKVIDYQAILGKIDKCDEFNFIEAGRRRVSKKKGNTARFQYDWLSLGLEDELKTIETGNVENGMILSTSQLDKEGNQLGIEAIGTLYVDRFLFRLETRSLELAEFSVRHFARLFGDALTFKRIIKKKMDDSQKQEHAEEFSEPSEAERVNPKLIKKVAEQYYLDLLDQKIPQLNNMSPREARKDPSVYPMLIEWLKGLENMIERNKRKGETLIPIEKIKKELHIDW